MKCGRQSSVVGRLSRRFSMRIGLQLPSFSWPGGTAAIGSRLAEIGRTADHAGFASIWVMDHFLRIPVVGPPEEPMLEGYSALSHLAAGRNAAQLAPLLNCDSV